MAEERLNNASPPDQNYCQDVSKVIKKETQNVYSSFNEIMQINADHITIKEEPLFNNRVQEDLSVGLSDIGNSQTFPQNVTLTNNDALNQSLTNESLQRFTCLKCDFQTTSKHILQQHCLSHAQNAEISKKSKENSLWLQINDLDCDDSQFDLGLKAKNYKGWQFVCTLCRFTTASKKDLKGHIFTHYTLESGCNSPLNCQKCSYKSQNKAMMTNHIFSHNDLFKYACTTCDFVANHRNTVAMHVQIHHTKPLVCSFCNYQTTRSQLFKEHMLDHTGFKKFKCPDCDYATNRKVNLNTHSFIHQGKKRFKCAQCDHETNRKYNLKMHLLSNHNSEKEEDTIESQKKKKKRQTVIRNEEEIKLKIESDNVKYEESLFIEDQTNRQSITTHALKQEEEAIVDIELCESMKKNPFISNHRYKARIADGAATSNAIAAFVTAFALGQMERAMGDAGSCLTVTFEPSPAPDVSQFTALIPYRELKEDEEGSEGRIRRVIEACQRFGSSEFSVDIGSVCRVGGEPITPPAIALRNRKKVRKSYLKHSAGRQWSIFVAATVLYEQKVLLKTTEANDVELVSRAGLLARECGLHFVTAFGEAEFDVLERVLNVRLCVMGNADGRFAFLYKSRQQATTLPVFCIAREGPDYVPLLNPVVAFPISFIRCNRALGFCEGCLHFYRNLRKHDQDCPFICLQCRSNRCSRQQVPDEARTCSECNRLFLNNLCFELHLAKTCNCIKLCTCSTLMVRNASGKYTHQCDGTRDAQVQKPLARH